MKGFIFSILMLLSFGANAVVLNQLGFLFDDNAEQVFSGQTVFWEEEGSGSGWEDGALDFNNYVAGGGLIFDYFDTSNNDTVGGPLNPNNIEIWTNDFNNETTPGTVSFWASDNDPNPSPGQTLLLTGTLASTTYTVTGGALAPWFDTGVFIWNGSFVQDENGTLNPFTLTMTASPVPVPAAVWMFISGLISLVTVARRRRV